MGQIIKALDNAIVCGHFFQERVALVISILDGTPESFQGYFVHTPAGRIGLVVEISPKGRCTVQFGPDGSHEFWAEVYLTFASYQSIKDALLDGVGANPAPY